MAYLMMVKLVVSIWYVILRTRIPCMRPFIIAFVNLGIFIVEEEKVESISQPIMVELGRN